jgi:hypothetical protein
MSKCARAATPTKKLAAAEASRGHGATQGCTTYCPVPAVHEIDGGGLVFPPDELGVLAAETKRWREGDRGGLGSAPRPYRPPGSVLERAAPGNTAQVVEQEPFGHGVVRADRRVPPPSESATCGGGCQAGLAREDGRACRSLSWAERALRGPGRPNSVHAQSSFFSFSSPFLCYVPNS